MLFKFRLNLTLQIEMITLVNDNREARFIIIIILKKSCREAHISILW